MSQPMSVRLAREAEKSLTEADETLKNYRFLKAQNRSEMDDFFNRLPEPYYSFARYRYQMSHTMETVAEEMGYSTRAVYKFRKKVLKWWVLFLTGKQCG